MKGADISPEKALDVARRILSRRDHGRAELGRKLRTRGLPPPLIGRTLDQLEASGLLDDAKCSRALIESELARGHGLVYIWAKLRQRGLPALRDPGDLEAEAESLRSFVRRKRLAPAALTGAPEKARILRFLRGRGYTSGAIAAVLGPLSEREED
jgi:regulatory protein